MEHIPFISITARDHYDLGVKLGRALKKQIQLRLKTNDKLYRKILKKGVKELAEIAVSFLPATMWHHPSLVTELEGMSAGAEVRFEDLLVLMCEEELMDMHDMKFSKCTTVALRTKKGILVGHNEDWMGSYAKNGLYVLKLKMGCHRSLSVNYIGSLPGSGCGLSGNGLCFTANSLNPGRFRYGVPVKFQFRAILEARSLKEAVHCDIEDSSIAGSTTYGWKNSKIVDIEDFFGHHETFTRKKLLIHTNHPLKRKEQQKSNTPRESVVRLRRAQELLQDEKEFSLEGLKALLKDHKANICSHTAKHTTWGATITSVIMNPGEQWMEVCWSNPCTHSYHRYVL